MIGYQYRFTIGDKKNKAGKNTSKWNDE